MLAGMSKFQELVASRRLWVALISTVIALWLFYTGQIDSAQLSTWLEMASGVYGGSVGIEHALKTWAENTRKGEK